MLGNFSNNYIGSLKNIIDEGGIGRNPDFKLQYLLDNTKGGLHRRNRSHDVGPNG